MNATTANDLIERTRSRRICTWSSGGVRVLWERDSRERIEKAKSSRIPRGVTDDPMSSFDEICNIDKYHEKSKKKRALSRKARLQSKYEDEFSIILPYFEQDNTMPTKLHHNDKSN